jgi:hypothetical protein
MGWMLLYRICMENKIRLSQEELWESNPHFLCYPLEDFKKYDDDMIGVFVE